ncbi:MAG: KamA family radical SAM protein [Methanomassiliicoccales archaeon]|nr:KamA family radical SAM protein [Methanomassiliicoccales archaeon]
MNEREHNNVITTFKDHLSKLDPHMDGILLKYHSKTMIRRKLTDLINTRRSHFNGLDYNVDDLERVVALNCLSTMENFISERNEVVSKSSVLKGLMAAYSGNQDEAYTYAFYVDLINVIKGAQALSGIYDEEAPAQNGINDAETTRMRSDHLDKLALRCRTSMAKYPNGLNESVIANRLDNRRRILSALGGEEDHWWDYKWQRKNTIRNSATLSKLIDLTEEESNAIELAVKNHIPFGITPYYVSLMDKDTLRRNDHAVRAQVIPKEHYLKQVLSSLTTKDKSELDFMKEGVTSPVPLVTRRYPMIAIMKPYNSCAQICVYCQRNWEIRDIDIDQPTIDDRTVDKAIEWFSEHPMVSEVLLTGGDPVLLEDKILSLLIKRFSEIDHITRIRIGTRIPVVLPMRFTESLLTILEEAHNPPKQELCIVTHVEHPYEITPEFVTAIQSIRKRGMSVYNQQVFTFENSRRFETAALRELLKRAGVDPYYTFNTKGKEETQWFRVPIARLLQERKEEARLLPGLTRTDEPVFNIPALGKNHLRAWQHHDMIMITPEGERVYEFHPWEKNIVTAPTYIHRDVPIMDYLDRLQGIEEDPSDYWSIWYYF